MTLYVEPNEERSDIPRLLKSMNIHFERKSLSGPDYFVGLITDTGELQGIPVERKEIGDYFQSKQSGHLDEQLYNLSYNFPLSYLCIIGSPSMALVQSFKRAQETGGQSFSHKAYISSLIGSSLKRAPDGVGGIIVTVNLETDTDFALFLSILNEKFEKGDYVRIPKFVRHAKSPEEELIYIVTSLPHIGRVTAQALIEHFGDGRPVDRTNLTGTLEKLFTASEEELMEVKGIGKKIALELRARFGLIYKPEVGEVSDET